MWQADLRGVNLRDVNFSGCEVATSVFTEAFGGVNVMAFSPDGRLLAAGTTRGEMRVWHVPDGILLLRSTLQGHGGYVWSVAFSPDGALLASGSQDESIKLWDVRTGQCLSTLQGHTNVVLSVAFRGRAKILTKMVTIQKDYAVAESRANLLE
jgi:WD40 repeat protein